jgi:hypothetical protein
LSSVIGSIHAALALVFAWLWKPIEFLSPTLQLAVVSALFGIVMVLVYGKISNQGAIRKVKEQIGAALLEVVLFRRDVRISLRAQASLLWAGVKYFLLAMGPVLVLAIPFALVLGHINLRLGARPLQVGEPSVLAVSVAKGTDVRSIQLSAPSGIDVVGPVRIPKSESLYWRLTPQQPGDLAFDLRSAGGASLSEALVAGAASRTPPAGIFLSTSNWPAQMLFPNGSAAQRLDTAPLQSVELTYPQREYVFFGLGMSWITAFLIISILAGYAGSRVFGISV